MTKLHVSTEHGWKPANASVGLNGNAGIALVCQYRCQAAGDPVVGVVGVADPPAWLL